MLRFPYVRVAIRRGAAPEDFLTKVMRFFLWLFGQGAPLKSPQRVLPPQAGAATIGRPLVPVRIIGRGHRSLRQTALLDTGAVETILSLEVATAIGVDPGPEEGSIRWRGQAYARRVADVELELTRTGITWRWPARVVFSPAPVGYLLLGDRGCLQYMDAKFRGEERLVELETSNSFPGVVRSSLSDP